MSYFSKFLRAAVQPAEKPTIDHVQEFQKSWHTVKDTLVEPDERQLSKGIASTNVPDHIRSMVDALVSESSRVEKGETGECMEYLLKNDVLGTLVRLSETDRPAGIQAEVLRAVQNMVVLLDNQFLVHSAVHRAVLRLLRTCVGDDLQEKLDGRNKVMGAAGSLSKTSPSEHEEDLVNLLCILCSRILTYRELLMIFFHDKHWYRSEPLFSVEEEDEDEDEDDEDEDEGSGSGSRSSSRSPSPTLSQETITDAQPSSSLKKTEYEFLLFNYLLRFVHREGQIGDFARAGLLFLIDVAMYPGDAGPNQRQQGDEPGSPVHDPVNDAAVALAEYILEGDFCEVLGAGLNAVYSLLPRKLGFFPQLDQDTNPSNVMTIGGSGIDNEDEREKIHASKDRHRAMGIEDAHSTDVKARLDHFLKLLEFLQDVVRKNVEHEGLEASSLIGARIVQSILGAVRRTFLENVFYPSLLECTDTDGSAVAVMSYIEVIVRTLRPGPLLDLIIDFLLSEDNDGQPSTRSQALASNAPPVSNAASDKAAKIRRRKSSAMVLLEMEAPDSRKKSDYFTSTSRFTLRDLLLANLKSQHTAAATTALQLLSTMLVHQTPTAAERLLAIIPDLHATCFPHPGLLHGVNHLQRTMSAQEEVDADFDMNDQLLDNTRPSPPIEPLFYQPETTFSTHEREMGLYLGLISRVDPSHVNEGFSTGYEHYLHDALLSIQSQPLYRHADDYGLDGHYHSLKHRLNANDPVLSQLLEHTRAFFANTPEFNVALTGVFATLAINPYRSLAGWLTFAHNDVQDRYAESTSGKGDMSVDGRDDRSIDSWVDEKLSSEISTLPAASMNDHSRPVVYTVLQSLLNQLERYRFQVDDFEMFLKERRQGLLFSEKLTDALEIMLDDDFRPKPTSPLPQDSLAKPKPKSTPSATSVFASFLTPKKSKPKAPDPVTPQRDQRKVVAPSPFGAHYQQTSAITVEPSIAPVPFTALWTPSKKVDWNVVEEDVFGSTSWSERSMISETGDDDQERDDEKPSKPATVTLSQLLDNVVILEESIKELVAIIHARRSLGIDALRYV
ncbi:Retinoic acid induced 16-like protein-domain-containing protein [Coprinopsis sp. MPI-PUGE-AT-0042]|nr:Retinoic acid induced 16-like protein-domain-containing protein [Coprinopsis sp. MPI-PUGE-AT-0042]